MSCYTFLVEIKIFYVEKFIDKYNVVTSTSITGSVLVLLTISVGTDFAYSEDASSSALSCIYTNETNPLILVIKKGN